MNGTSIQTTIVPPEQPAEQPSRDRRVDRRTLEKYRDLAQSARDALVDDPRGVSEAIQYWDGVLDGLNAALGEPIFHIQEVKTYTLSRVQQ